MKKLIKDFIEKGAELEHDRWARWQTHVFRNSKKTNNGYLIPQELCEKWQRQIDTPYEKLSEQEKESDRKEVRKYLPLIRQLLKKQRQEILKAIENIERSTTDEMLKTIDIEAFGEKILELKEKLKEEK